MPYVDTNGVRTYYEREGRGRPVVFVHGAVVDHGQWEPQVAALREEYEVLTYDVRGHGRTGGSDLDAYTVGLFADDLHALLASLALDRPVLCGLSMGGCIAQVYAARHPDRVGGLVLADTFTAEVLDWRESLQYRLLEAALPLVSVLGYRRVERVVVRLYELLHGEEISGDGRTLADHGTAASSMTDGEFRKVIRALTRFEDVSLDLSAITAPTLVAYGEHDAAFVRRHAAELRAAVRDATVRTVPDAGHVSNRDNPAAFDAALRTFLADRAWPAATDR